MPKNQKRVGFAMIPNCIIRSGKLTPKALVVYLSLKSHAGDSGFAWPKHQTIADEVNISKSAVKTALLELKEIGLVSWVGRIRPTDSGQTSNRYRLHDDGDSLKRLFPPAPEPPDNYQEEEPLEGQQALNSSLNERKRRRNPPSTDLPISKKQRNLIHQLYLETDSPEVNELCNDEIENLSRADADEVIREVKLIKWKDELYR